MSAFERKHESVISGLTVPWTIPEWITEPLSWSLGGGASRLLAFLLVTIFTAEALIIFTLRSIDIQDAVLESIIDVTLLTLVLFSALYVFVFKKLIRKNKQLADSESQLVERVELRTKEIEKAKNNLEESLSRFTDIAEVAGGWIWETDSDLRFSYASDRLFELLPIAREDFIGKTREEFADAGTDSNLWRNHLDDLANHRPFRNFEYPVTLPDGSTRYILISGKPVFGADGVFKGYRGTGLNKTSEVEARRALEEGEKRFRDLVGGSIQGVFIHYGWTPFFTNQALADIFGYESPEEILALGTIEPLIAPEERERLWSYKAARQNDEDVADNLEVRGLKKDGSSIWLEFRMMQIDGYGDPVMQCFVIDITKRKRAEETLQEQKEYLDKILQNIPRAIITADENGTIKTFNAAAEKTFGYAAEEVIDRNVNILMPAPHESNQFGHIRSYQQSGKPNFIDCGPRQITGLHNDGREFPMELAVAKVGRPGKREFVGIARDISDRLKTDKALRQQNELFNAALDNMSQGLCMFDGEQRLIVCNERYASMYGLKFEQVTPGITLRQIIAYRIENGLYDYESPDDYIKEKLNWASSDVRDSKIVHLNNGRSIKVDHQPMPDGGWLDTHEDVTELLHIEERLARLAHHDALTDLANRVLWRERMEEELKRVRRGGAFALLYLDLDGFKAINDTLGHAAGDQLLKSVAKRLRNCVRETDLVARMGGDEFAIVQVTTEQSEDATALAARICDVISVPFIVDGQEVMVETSIGIAIAPKDGADQEQLVRRADLALYLAKTQRGGAYRLFDPQMEENRKDRHALGLDLRKALANDELELYYQPLFNLESNTITGFEALLRWHHPEHGMVPPSDFIPIAEEIGVIHKIGKWVLHQACAEAATWPDAIKVAVNVSPVQFSRGDLLQIVDHALAASGLPPARLELEITESVLLHNEEATLATLHQLHESGVLISMDDFGTGYSSLSYLRSFPFNKIKIDATFVKDLTKGEGGIAIVRAVVGLASMLNVETTAEGVETEEQLEIIRAEGCTEVQGYLFSRPIPAKKIRRLISQHRPKRLESAA